MTGWRLALWFALRPKLWCPTLSMAMHLAQHLYDAALVKAIALRDEKAREPARRVPMPEAW